VKQYTSIKVPANMYTKAKLKKMGLTPISEHSAHVTFPPSKRRYKLYKLENARPIDSTSGYSLLFADNSEEARQRFEDIRKDFLANEQKFLRYIAL
jgi:hypothetical protein